MSDSSLLPSAFSTLEVQASFGKTPSGTSRIRYRNVTTPMFLAARVSPVVYTDVTKDDIAGAAASDEEGSAFEGTSKVLKGEAVIGSLLTKPADGGASDAKDPQPAAFSSSSSLSSSSNASSYAASVSANGERRLQSSSSADNSEALLRRGQVPRLGVEEVPRVSGRQCVPIRRSLLREVEYERF